MAAVFVLCSLLPTQDEADEIDLLGWARKLDALDLSWRSGEFELQLSGQLNLELFIFGKEAPGVHVEDALLRAGRYEDLPAADSPEVNGRVLLALDATYGKWLEASIEGRLDGTTSVNGHAEVHGEQYWARVRIPDQPGIKLQVGRFPAPIGNFIPRWIPEKNPLTTWPLPYDAVTALDSVGGSTATLRSDRDGIRHKDWRVPIWQGVSGTGVMVLGTIGDFTYAAAATNSAPATSPAQWGSRVGSPRFMNLYLHGEVVLDITTKVGASWSRGPYEHNEIEADPAEGTIAVENPEDFQQTLAGLNLEFSTGHLQVYSEVFWSRFETAQFGNPRLWTYYVEAKYAFLPGLFGAVRFSQMFFGDVRDAAGQTHAWDRDLTRAEFGGGYFFTRNFFLKTTMQLNYTMGGREPRDHLLMMQLGLTF